MGHCWYGLPAHPGPYSSSPQGLPCHGHWGPCPLGFYRVTAGMDCLPTLGPIAAAPRGSPAMATGAPALTESMEVSEVSWLLTLTSFTSFSRHTCWFPHVRKPNLALE